MQLIKSAAFVEKNLVSLHEVCHDRPRGLLLLRCFELRHRPPLLPHCRVRAEHEVVRDKNSNSSKPRIKSKRLIAKRPVGDLHQGVVFFPPAPPLDAVAQSRLEQLEKNRV